jgi:hypothetical protein
MGAIVAAGSCLSSFCSACVTNVDVGRLSGAAADAGDGGAIPIADAADFGAQGADAGGQDAAYDGPPGGTCIPDADSGRDDAGDGPKVCSGIPGAVAYLCFFDQTPGPNCVKPSLFMGRPWLVCCTAH